MSPLQFPPDSWYKDHANSHNMKPAVLKEGLQFSDQDIDALKRGVEEAYTQQGLPLQTDFRSSNGIKWLLAIKTGVCSRFSANTNYSHVFAAQPAWLSRNLDHVILRHHNNVKRRAESRAADSILKAAKAAKVPHASHPNHPPPILELPQTVSTLAPSIRAQAGPPVAWADLEVHIFRDNDPEPIHVNVYDAYLSQDGRNIEPVNRSSTSFDYQLFIQDLRDNCAYVDTDTISYMRSVDQPKSVIKGMGFWRAAVTNMRFVQCLQVLRFYIASAERLDSERIELVTSGTPKAIVQESQSRGVSQASGMQPPEVISGTPETIVQETQSIRGSQSQDVQAPQAMSAEDTFEVGTNSILGLGISQDTSAEDTTGIRTNSLPGVGTPALEPAADGIDTSLKRSRTDNTDDQGSPSKKGKGMASLHEQMPTLEEMPTPEQIVSNAQHDTQNNIVDDQINIEDIPFQTLPGPIRSSGRGPLRSRNDDVPSNGQPTDDSVYASEVSTGPRYEMVEEVPETANEAGAFGMSPEEDPHRTLSKDAMDEIAQRLKDFGAIGHEDLQLWKSMCTFFKHPVEDKFGADDLINLRGLTVGLKPHQAYAIFWAVTRPFCGNNDLRGGFIADDMGLGKTIEAIGIIVVRAWLIRAGQHVLLDRKKALENPNYKARHLPPGTLGDPQAPESECPLDSFGIQCPCIDNSWSARMALSGVVPTGPTLIVAPPSLCTNWNSEFAKFVTSGANDLKLRAFLRHGKASVATAAETMVMRDNIQFRITFDKTTSAGWTGTIKLGSYQSVVITSPACIESRVVTPTLYTVPSKQFKDRHFEGKIHGIAWGLMFRDEYHNDKGLSTISSTYFNIANITARDKVGFNHRNRPWMWALSGTPFDISISDVEAHWSALSMPSWDTDRTSLMAKSTHKVLKQLDRDWRRLTNIRTKTYTEPSVTEVRKYSKQLLRWLHPWTIRRMADQTFFSFPIISLPPLMKCVVDCKTPPEYIGATAAIQASAHAEWKKKLEDWQKRRHEWVARGKKTKEPAEPNERGRNSGEYYYLRLSANFPNIPVLRTYNHDWSFMAEDVSKAFASSSGLSASYLSKAFGSIIQGSTKLLELEKILFMMINSTTAQVQPEKMIIFSYNPVTAFLLSIWFERVFTHVKAVVVLQGTTIGKRQTIVDAFCGEEVDDEIVAKSAGDARVLISTLALMGTGYTINRARWVIIFDCDWVQREHNQAMKRCHRIGQTESVQLFELRNVDNPAEMAIAAIHASRGKMMDTAFSTTNQELEDTGRSGRSGARTERIVDEEEQRQVEIHRLARQQEEDDYV